MISSYIYHKKCPCCGGEVEVEVQPFNVAYGEGYAFEKCLDCGEYEDEGEHDW